jgi:predicted O-methyltransferase YrrM
MNNEQHLKLLDEIKTSSEQQNIPIVRSKTIAYIQNLIKENGYKNVLEIGTAYGFSACAMTLCESITKIVTIEKNKNNFEIASNFLKHLNNIICINADAFLYIPNQKFDLIFIDGPKSHQDILVRKYLNYLNDKGVMVIDNIFLLKFEKLPKLTKNQLHLVERVKEFHH